MAVTESGLFAQTLLTILNATQLAVAPLADTINVAMFTNSITPNFDTDTAYGSAPYNANEVAGAGYVAGGAALGTKALVNSPSKSVAFTAATTSWTTATITNARCALIYDNTTSPKAPLVLVNFAGDFSSTAGTFSIVWATPIFSIVVAA